jgi:hypothetical protein
MEDIQKILDIVYGRVLFQQVKIAVSGRQRVDGKRGDERYRELMEDV